VSNTLISRINIEDVPSQEARTFKAVGLIGEIEVKEVANGYLQVAVPLTYRLHSDDTQDRQFTARFNLRPEWLTPEYSAKVKSGNVTESERIQYNINVKGLLKGLFTGAGVTAGSMDFNLLTGRTVGFKTRNRRNDPSRLDVSYFFPVKS
jgi:hypothetical protein